MSTESKSPVLSQKHGSSRPIRTLIRSLLLACFLAFSIRLTASDADLTGLVVDANRHADMPASLTYARQVARLIKWTWSRSIEKRDDVPYGTTVVHVSVDRRGKVFNPRVISGLPQKLPRQLALDAIIHSTLPEMPEAVIKELDGKRLGLDVTFDLRPPPK